MSLNKDRFWGVLPAAGVGSRMSSDIPKQYLPLCRRTVLEHSLDALLTSDLLEAVMVAVSPQDNRPLQMACFENEKVKCTAGGASRGDSVLAALIALREYASSSDWVVVHDAARPCLSQADIHSLISAVKKNGVGGILAEPIVDTVKLAYDDKEVVKTMNRNHLWRAQTPQVFRLGLLISALEEAIDGGHAITDEASAMELSGHSVQLVPGSSCNIKITLPEDLALAEFYLERACDRSGEAASCE